MKNSWKEIPSRSFFYGVSPFCAKCDQAYKPSSVVDSHLSWPGVATRLAPPPRNAQGYASCSSTVLLRIGFTGPRGLPRAGELLPRLSILTENPGGISLLHFPWGRPRRRLAVILALGSSDFPQTGGFPRRPRPSSLLTQSLFYKDWQSLVNRLFQKASDSFRPTASGKGPHSSCGDSQTG